MVDNGHRSSQIPYIFVTINDDDENHIDNEDNTDDDNINCIDHIYCKQ